MNRPRWCVPAALVAAGTTPSLPARTTCVAWSGPAPSRRVTAKVPEEIRDDTIVYRDLTTLEIHRIRADTFIISTGIAPNKGLYDQLSESPFRTFGIGDCVGPGAIKEAVFDGAHAAFQI